MNKETFQTRYNKGNELLKTATINYYQDSKCACQYPRFTQIVGINCIDFSETFKSSETTLLINLVRPYFDKEKLEIGQEGYNEKWTCTRCGSEFLYGWSDFSIALERDFLSRLALKTTEKGKPAIQPIPLYIGLQGYSYPSKEAIQSVDFNTFANYILET